jgi:NifB/MoaA-like Fe-S oxidoreductase
LEIIETVNTFGESCLKETGSRIFYAADELFLRAGRPMPEAEYYEDYPQLENGVGMISLFKAEFTDALELADLEATPPPFSVATGAAAAPFIEKLLSMTAEKWYNTDCTVYAVKNDFFGHTVDVAGLVVGGDLIAQLSGRDLKADC